MEVIKAIIVGIVQGLTEFLPVSSSGHIVIAQEILGLKYEEDQNLMFAIILHFATALSTIVVFRKDILEIIKGLFQFKWNEQTQFSLKIILSMIPAVIVGLFLKDTLEELFSNLRLVGFMLLITATLLYIADKAKSTGKDISYKDSIIIGLAQAVAALLPGISRSGSTISTSIILSDDKAKAARFSFLMVLPLIIGAAAKEYLDASKAEAALTFDILPLACGFLAAFISGLFACKWMIEFVKKAKLKYFSIYCSIVGVFVILYTFLK
ncbi:undecaprenyl-diphosphate phosphatase [Flavobacterium agricola]|uniref:Undecaprenyl-diphosphatase n=1 Tax=Flavobacterium agricola TaxID=2870839 RepID=A0ABY6M2G8_9FLAO|nr:undecaprenyl-diphosphate phosphatase [Flavobacterium agricola]UYW02656.1 undecaprenyl-diphosphate phosphatase [Flavobacterium agricola]